MNGLLSALDCLIPPPVLLLLFGVLASVVANAFPWTVPIPMASTIAIVVGLVGLALNLVPKATFRRVGTTVNPLQPGSASVLVRTGLYGYTRNPMYLGHVLMLVAWVIWLQNLAAVPLVFVHIAYLTRFQIVPEERLLARRFAGEFLAYFVRTPRWW